MLPAAAALDSTAAPTPALTTPNTATPTVASPDVFPPSSASHLVVSPPGAAPAAGTAAADEFDEPFSLGESQGLAGVIIPIEITRDDSDTHTVLVTSAPAATKAVGGAEDVPGAPEFTTTVSLHLPTGEPREPATLPQGGVGSAGIAPTSDSSAVPPSSVGGGTLAASTSPPVDSSINVMVSVSPASRLPPAPPKHAPLGHLMMSPRPPPMSQRARTSSPGTHDKMLGPTALGGGGPKNIPSIATAASLGGLITVSDDRHTPPLMTAAHPPPTMMMNVRPMNAGGLMPHPPTLHHHHSLSARLPSLSPAANHPTGGGAHTPLPGPTAPPLAFAPAPPASSGAASQFLRGQQQPVQNGQMSEEAAAMLPFTPLGGGNHHYQQHHQHGKLMGADTGGAFLGLGGLASANASTNVHPGYVTSSPQQQSQATGPNSSPPSLALGTESLDATVRSVYRAHQQQPRPPQAPQSFLMTEGIITTATPTPLPPPAVAEMGGGVGAVGDSNNNGGAAGATMVGLPGFGVGTPPAVAVVAPASPSTASGTPPPPLAVTAATEGTGSFRAFGASPALPGGFLLGASPAPFSRGGLPRSFSGEVPGRRGSRGDLPPL
jgi:hypothetical protein